jgi:hypothetical protein
MAELVTSFSVWVRSNYLLFFGFVIAIAALVFIMIYFLGKPKKQNLSASAKFKDADGNPVAANTFVYDHVAGRYSTYIDWGDKAPGIPMKYSDGIYYYEVQLSRKNKTGKDAQVENDLSHYKPLPQAVKSKSPRAWYRALHDVDVGQVFPVAPSLWEKLGILEGYIFIGLLIFLILIHK